MCISLPARVVSISGPAAEVEIGDLRHRVLVMTDGVKVGSWVLIYAGAVLTVLSEEAALDTGRLLGQLQAAQHGG